MGPPLSGGVGRRGSFACGASRLLQSHWTSRPPEEVLGNLDLERDPPAKRDPPVRRLRSLERSDQGRSRAPSIRLGDRGKRSPGSYHHRRGGSDFSRPSTREGGGDNSDESTEPEFQVSAQWRTLQMPA